MLLFIIIHRLVCDTGGLSSFLSFFLSPLFILFYFGDIRLGWLSCLVLVKKVFVATWGFLILGLSLNIFFYTGGGVCYFLCTRLDLEV